VTADGFPDGSRWTPVPDLFFSRYLPELGDPLAIGVGMLVLWRSHRRAGDAPAAVRQSDLAADAVVARFVTGLDVPESDVSLAVADALDMLVSRGLLLEARTAGEDGPARWVFVNDHDGRAAYRKWSDGGLLLPDVPAPPTEEPLERPSVFKLYEQNIGVITPMLADDLREAARLFPEDWIEDAVRQAVANNARKWSYVEAILQRWAREGRSDEADRRGASEGRERDSDGPYAAFVRH
jgi:DnaD/phage-associated family protein